MDYLLFKDRLAATPQGEIDARYQAAGRHLDGHGTTGRGETGPGTDEGRQRAPCLELLHRSAGEIWSLDLRTTTPCPSSSNLGVVFSATDPLRACWNEKDGVTFASPPGPGKPDPAPSAFAAAEGTLSSAATHVRRCLGSGSSSHCSLSSSLAGALRPSPLPPPQASPQPLAQASPRPPSRASPPHLLGLRHGHLGRRRRDGHGFLLRLVGHAGEPGHGGPGAGAGLPVRHARRRLRRTRRG
ncbi:atherin-like [Panicum hallii]|uniref:atherin-like n=1 Tax=Panicum hallii TaxID=206008 RepID=UPI000DF4D455|nr:atherin-like [Panicum hallii]